MAKIVHSKYYRKKTGVWVEKTYVYDKEYKQRRTARGLTFIGKGGRLYKENIDKFLNQRDEFGDRIFSKSEENDIRAWIRDEYENINRRRDKDGKYRPLTATSIKAHLTESKLDRLFVNMGTTMEEVQDELGVTEAQLRKGKWDGNIFKVNGKSYEFVKDYYGSIFKEVR